ncbi:6PGL phosphogluconolactonase, partial [Acromyrmex heyeri]
MTGIVVATDEEQLLSRISNLIARAADDAISRDDRIFRFGVSGGSVVQLLAKSLPNIATDWSKWRFFFCDERVVPLDDSESNFGLYKSCLIGKVPVTEEQFMKTNAAKDYIKKMAFFFPPDRLPRFDCLLLGIGQDGHTCSLFPGHRALDDENMWVTWELNAPKPPPSRISLTMPVINNARMCVFIVTGASKAEIVKRILRDKEDLPATRVEPVDGTLFWLLDQEAGRLLNSD